MVIGRNQTCNTKLFINILGKSTRMTHNINRDFVRWRINDECDMCSRKETFSFEGQNKSPLSKEVRIYCPLYDVLLLVIFIQNVDDNNYHTLILLVIKGQIRSPFNWFSTTLLQTADFFVYRDWVLDHFYNRKCALLLYRDVALSFVVLANALWLMKNNFFQYIRFRDILQDTRQVRFAFLLHYFRLLIFLFTEIDFSIIATIGNVLCFSLEM
jgi:hypothetical protein